MVEVRGSYVGETATGINYVFHVIARGGINLKKIIVRSEGGIELALDPPLEPCSTDSHVGWVRDVPRSWFPLTVEVMDCEHDHVYNPDEFGRFGVFERIPENDLDTRFPCNALVDHCSDDTVCNAALSDVASVRRNLLWICNDVRRLREEVAALFAAAAFFFVASALSLLIALNVTGIPFVGWLIASAFIAAATVFFYYGVKMFRQAEEKLGKLIRKQEAERIRRTKFEQAVSVVEENCCPGCVKTDISTPC